MKDLKHIKRFNESEENLNISDVKFQLPIDFNVWKNEFEDSQERQEWNANEMLDSREEIDVFVEWMNKHKRGN
jgi:uncharacterized protein YcbX